MAITLASANAALEREGFVSYELLKHIDGTLKIEHDPIGELGAIRYIETGATRVRDLTITQVVGLVRKDYAQFQEQKKKLLDNAAAVASVAEVDWEPTKPEQILSDMRSLITNDSVKVEPKGDATPRPHAANFIPLTGNPDALPPSDARYKLIPTERPALGSHQDRRSKGPHTSKPAHHVKRAKPAAHGWVDGAMPSFRTASQDANAAFIEKHLNKGQWWPAGTQVLLQRSGSVLFRSGDEGVSVKLWNLIGSKYMRDRSPSWWRSNVENIIKGRPLLVDEHPLPKDRVAMYAGLLSDFKRKATPAGHYAFMVIAHDGRTEMRHSVNLREAFSLVNVGERVFIPTDDIKRYDAEVRKGMHGAPSGAAEL